MITEIIPYKKPLCWLGQYVTDIRLKQRAPGDDRPIDMDDLELVERPATEDDIQPGCTCDTPMKAFWCHTGHLTECHVGKSCSAAKCSHLAKYE